MKREFRIGKIFWVFLALLGLCIIQYSRENAYDYKWTDDCSYVNVQETLDDATIEFRPLDNAANLLVINDNLCKKGIQEWGNIQKTDWFPVTEENQFLTIYGGFNYSVWEFENSKGEKTLIDHSNEIFNDAMGITLDTKNTDTVEIPKDSVRCKVSYYKKDTLLSYAISGLKGLMRGVLNGNIKEEVSKRTIVLDMFDDSPVYICYGAFPQSTSKHSETVYKIKKGESKITLDLHAGEIVYLDTDSDLRISGGKKDANIGEYGIKYSINDTNMVCERVGDAQYLHANYKIGDNWAGIYKNDFDSIYPWSEIKECYIAANGDKSYEKMEGCDVMVEIPKFYIKRERKENEEYIWISESYKEGYELDPAFINEKGGICNFIYVGKYLSSVDENIIYSKENAVPLIDLSVNEISELFTKKHESFDELDLDTLNCLQRLWLVEYGIKNSQAIFAGYVESTFVKSTDDDPKISISSKKGSNIIEIAKMNYTEKFDIGDSVAVFSYKYENKYSPYLHWTLNYINDDEEWQRTISSIQVKQSENDGGEYLQIEFTGPPVDITKGETIITNLPQVTGKTNEIEYHTGIVSAKPGKEQFKYRGIENLWGTVCVILSDVYVDDGVLFKMDSSGNFVSTDLTIPTQYKGGGMALGHECAVRELSYIEGDKGLMFPSKLGGASLSNNYGDWFVYPKGELDPYDRIDPGEKQYITYGMTWDLSIYGGLFAYRVYPTENTRMVENGSRMVFK